MDTSSSETRNRNKSTATKAENQDINNYKQQLSKSEKDMIFRGRLSQNIFHNTTIMIIVIVFFILILSGV